MTNKISSDFLDPYDVMKVMGGGLRFGNTITSQSFRATRKNKTPINRHNVMIADRRATDDEKSAYARTILNSMETHGKNFSKPFGIVIGVKDTDTYLQGQEGVDHFVSLYYDREGSRWIITDTLNYTKAHDLIAQHLNELKSEFKKKYGITWEKIEVIPQAYDNGKNDCAINALINSFAIPQICKMARVSDFQASIGFLTDSIKSFRLSPNLIAQIRSKSRTDLKVLEKFHESLDGLVFDMQQLNPVSNSINSLLAQANEKVKQNMKASRADKARVPSAPEPSEEERRKSQKEYEAQSPFNDTSTTAGSKASKIGEAEVPSDPDSQDDEIYDGKLQQEEDSSGLPSYEESMKDDMLPAYNEAMGIYPPSYQQSQEEYSENEEHANTHYSITTSDDMKTNDDLVLLDKEQDRRVQDLRHVINNDNFTYSPETEFYGSYDGSSSLPNEIKIKAEVGKDLFDAIDKMINKYGEDRVIVPEALKERYQNYKDSSNNISENKDESHVSKLLRQREKDLNACNGITI